MTFIITLAYILFFGLRIHLNLGVLIVILSGILLIFALDLFSAGFRIATKATQDPLNWFFNITAQPVSGLYFPPDKLPSFLKEECENGKLVLPLRVEIKVNSLHNELGELERQILDFILDNDEVTQSELSRLFGRAQACRAVKDLENKGLVRRERKGRTYVLRMV